MNEALTTHPQMKQEIVQGIQGAFYCLVIAYVLYLAKRLKFFNKTLDII
ncbi:hypothetical protein [Streptococcus gallolyticus]|nr:hypothetical protein [Streptococcus gallolyticus]MCY7187315.1 hypothetical protein [Streptococcus gallolyticus subsp. gallolyticus]